jgi:hypothetical protein
MYANILLNLSFGIGCLKNEQIYYTASSKRVKCASPPPPPPSSPSPSPTRLPAPIKWALVKRGKGGRIKMPRGRERRARGEGEDGLTGEKRYAGETYSTSVSSRLSSEDVGSVSPMKIQRPALRVYISARGEK